MIELTRCYRFPAAHILRRAGLSDAENQRLYGRCANPNGHGHDYGVEVTVTGPVDERTGWIVPPDRLDACVQGRILDRLSHRLLNDDPWFESAVPTAENVVRVIRRELRAALSGDGVRVTRVRLLETRRNEFECGEV